MLLHNGLLVDWLVGGLFGWFKDQRKKFSIKNVTDYMLGPS